MKIRNIILDLDETLISSIETKELKNKAKNEDYKKRKSKFKCHPMDEDYIITERPGVQKFLDFLFKNFNVSVWTAASKDYALFVIQKVVLQKSDRELDFILYGNHCDYSKERSECIKQLNQLFHLYNYNSKNTLIIDDNKNVHEKQTNIVLPIKPFQFFKKDSENDEQLEVIRQKILKLSNK